MKFSLMHVIAKCIKAIYGVLELLISLNVSLNTTHDFI